MDTKSVLSGCLCLMGYLVTQPGLLFCEPSQSLQPQQKEVESKSAFGFNYEDLKYFEVPEIDGRLSGRLAFSATVQNKQRIFVLDFDAKKVRPLVLGPANNSYPAWSPDGSKLAFASDRDGNHEIYLANWDGSSQKRLTSNSAKDDNPAWSPDGKKIVFYSESKKGLSNLFSLNIASRKRTRITNFNGRNTTPDWSPNGRYISYSTNRFWPGWDVCLWDLQRGAETCLLKGSDSFCRARWSFDGSFMAFSYGQPGNYNIGLLNYREDAKSAVTDLPGREYDATWSKDDRFLAFVGEAASGKNVFNIYVEDVGAEKNALVLKSKYSIRYLSWSAIKTIELESKRISETHKEEVLQVQKESSTKQQEKADSQPSPSPSPSPTSSPSLSPSPSPSLTPSPSPSPNPSPTTIDKTKPNKEASPQPTATPTLKPEDPSKEKSPAVADSKKVEESS